jgi:hypothetical protein
MAEIPTELRAVQGDRLYQHFYDVLVYYSVLERAASSGTAMPPMPRDGHATMRSGILNVEVMFPLFQVFRDAVAMRMPAEIVLPLRPTKQIVSCIYSTAGLNSVSIRFGAAIFAISCEEPFDWLRANGMSDVHTWPPIAGFCRYVRNAIAHRGHITVNDPQAATVSWNGLAYGPNDNGKAIIGIDLGFADFMILMTQLETEIADLRAGIT